MGFSASLAESSRVFEIHDGKVRGNLFLKFEVVQGIPTDYLRNNSGRCWRWNIIENAKRYFLNKEISKNPFAKLKVRASLGFCMLISARAQNDNVPRYRINSGVVVRNSDCLVKFTARVVDKNDIFYLARVQARQVKVRAVRRKRDTFHLRIYKNETHACRLVLPTFSGMGFPQDTVAAARYLHISEGKLLKWNSSAAENTRNRRSDGKDLAAGRTAWL